MASKKQELVERETKVDSAKSGEVTERDDVRYRVASRDEEGFIKEAEEKAWDEYTVEDRVAYRADGRYYQLLSYRGTEKQKELIDYVAKLEKISIQKLLETMIMPVLEEKYGDAFGK